MVLYYSSLQSAVRVPIQSYYHTTVVLQYTQDHIQVYVWPRDKCSYLNIFTFTSFEEKKKCEDGRNKKKTSTEKVSEMLNRTKETMKNMLKNDKKAAATAVANIEDWSL